MSDSVLYVKINEEWVGIPTIKGDTGPQGPTGPQGEQGPQGPTGPQGTTDYNDLINKPTIPVQGTITSGNTGYTTGGDVYDALGDISSVLDAINGEVVQ